MAVLKLACDDNTVLLVSGRTVIGSCRHTCERLRARAEPSGRFFRRPLTSTLELLLAIFLSLDL